MQCGRPVNTTRVIGKSQGYKGLPVADVQAKVFYGGELSIIDSEMSSTVTGPGTPIMMTAWLPTPREIAAINKGAAVVVQLVGVSHPPILVEVGEAPK